MASTQKPAPDKRYTALKNFIEKGNLQNFNDIFEIVPKSIFIRDSGINYARLQAKINNPEKFLVKDVMVIARLIGVDARVLFDKVASAIEEKESKKKRK